MAYSIVDLAGSGGQSNFTFSFPYLAASHIHVFIDGAETTAFSFNSTFVIHLTTPLSGSHTVRIQRVTPIAGPLVDFSNGSVLGESDLDSQGLQLLFAVQESIDDQVNSIHTDAAGNFDFLGKRGVNLATPINNNDAVNKGYWDGVTGTAAAIEAQAALAAIQALPVIDVSTFMQTVLPANDAAEARGLLGALAAASGVMSGTFTGTYTLAGTPTINSPTINTPSVSGGLAVADPTATLGLATKGEVDRQTLKEVYGGAYQNAAGDVTNDIDFPATSCMDDAGTVWISVAALTKQLDVNWVVGNNQGMLSTGAIANVGYYLWAIMRPDTGVTDYLADVSATAPTMPANYTKKRLIGYIERVAGAISLFKATERTGGGLRIDWSVPALQVDVAATLTTSRRTDTVKVPTAFSTIALLTVSILDAAAASGARITCPDETDAAPSLSVAPLCNIVTQVAAAAQVKQLRVRTSSTGTIAARSTIATMDNYRVQTDGFEWSRR
jgi:hypothetical protein